MVKLISHSFGTVVAIGISGNKQDVQHQYYSLYNHGATSADLNWLTSRFGFIWTTPKRLKKYFLNSSFFIVCQNQPDISDQAAKKEAKRLAEFRERKMREEHFINIARVVDYERPVPKEIEKEL